MPSPHSLSALNSSELDDSEVIRDLGTQRLRESRSGSDLCWIQTSIILAKHLYAWHFDPLEHNGSRLMYSEQYDSGCNRIQVLSESRVIIICSVKWPSKWCLSINTHSQVTISRILTHLHGSGPRLSSVLMPAHYILCGAESRKQGSTGRGPGTTPE